ncbi:hypothetical protein [Kineosporia sp. NBRC 101731]|uniref:hypothetical protein n=1 Tax=Kineosporia sp. NBRC 101731 TaxID=3032199 RepID=UPI0024A5065B|nr:hypothetical protein [Kineosporia sp. NBRC 101731]GLY32648.1 hypothetical protein Kisp02_60130 [Kineosporia sp. NBRC 101731]
MASGRATREARQQKVTERRLAVARAEAMRRALWIGSLVTLLVVAACTGLLIWQW